MWQLGLQGYFAIQCEFPKHSSSARSLKRLPLKGPLIVIHVAAVEGLADELSLFFACKKQPCCEQNGTLKVACTDAEREVLSLREREKVKEMQEDKMSKCYKAWDLLGKEKLVDEKVR